MSQSIVSRRGAVLAASTALGVGLAAGALTLSTRAQAATAGDIEALKNLLRAERGAIATYTAAKSVLDGATDSDPLFAFKGVVTAIALHFAGQHVDHAAKLADYIIDQGGVDDVGEGTSLVPADFVANIKNVIDLATNAEKGAAIAYTETQKSISSQDNAELIAAIGSTETQHFVVLQLVARGFVVPPSSTANQTTEAMADVAAKFSPASFVVSVMGSESLADADAIPFYTFSA